jgi:transmembrane sensor
VGQADTVRLADGSEVILGPASRLTVAPGYGEGKREVELDGQGLFTVTHDEARPFTVSAGDARVEDIGTVFSVQTQTDRDIRVVVTEGVVRVAPIRAPAEATVLNAGDRAVVEGGRVVAERNRATDADLAWTRGQLRFEATPMPEVADALRRWYGLNIGIEDTAIARGHLTSTFERESKEQVVQIIAMTLGAQVVQRGDSVILRAQGARR